MSDQNQDFLALLAKMRSMQYQFQPQVRQQMRTMQRDMRDPIQPQTMERDMRLPIQAQNMPMMPAGRPAYPAHQVQQPQLGLLGIAPDFASMERAAQQSPQPSGLLSQHPAPQPAMPQQGLLGADGIMGGVAEEEGRRILAMIARMQAGQ